mmetsp:Transcript_26173/g.59585  ORF Transcript_26173/g.59585 Transcript_26173/m.59585 type:complete len:260 (-) Transcript_26173:181-960(-)
MEGCARLPMLANSGRSTSSTGSACPWAASSTGSDAARDDGGQAPEFVPGPLRQDVSMQSLCNSFLEAQCLHESVGAIPDPWAGGESTASFRDIYGVFAPPTDQTIHVAVLPFTPAQAAAWAGYPLETNSMVLTICMAPTVVTPPLAQAEDTSPPPQSPEMTETTEAQPSTPVRRRQRQRIRAFTLIKPCSRVSALESDSQQSCPVCLESLRSGQRVRTLPCFHMLHNNCSVRYYRTRGVLPSCPVCRWGVGMLMDPESE